MITALRKPIALVIVLLAACGWTNSTFAQDTNQGTGADSQPKTYKQWLKDASALLKQGKFAEALAAAQAAGKLEPKGYEAPAMAALIFAAAHQPAEAKAAMAAAMALAPADKRASLEEMSKKIAAVTTTAPATSNAMSPEARIKYNALMLIARDADKAKLEDDRKRALREFMSKSAALLELVPNQTNIWVMRALTAVELDYPIDGFYAGRKLKELGLESSDDPNAQRAFAELDRKDWLGAAINSRDWSKWTTDQAKAAANDGDEEAQTGMGDWNYTGKSGLNQDYRQAAIWYRKAAEHGNAYDQFTLGWLYENGQGLDKDIAQAKGWYQKAAAQGYQAAKKALENLNQESEKSPPRPQTPDDFIERFEMTGVEAAAIRPLVTAVISDRGGVDNIRTPTGHEADDLRSAVEAHAPIGQLAAKLKIYYANSEDQTHPALSEAQEHLRDVLTTQQQAIAVLLGLL